MNRRNFLKHLPIAAVLPFLPAIPALPEPPSSKLSFSKSSVDRIARELDDYLAIKKLSDYLTLYREFARLEDSFRTMLEENRRENG